MSRVRRWIAGPVVLLAAVALCTWMFAKAHSRESGPAKEAPMAELSPAISRTANGDTLIQISRAEQTRIGLVTEALQPVSLPVEFTAYGAVVDPAPLMALNSQLEATQSTLAASRSQFDRARLLHAEGQNVSLKTFKRRRRNFVLTLPSFSF